MSKRIDKSPKNRTGILLLSGSAGELDWVMPILSLLLKKEFNFKIIFLTNHVHESVKKNNTLNNFINQKNDKLEIFYLGGFLFEKFERFSYLFHRLFLKFNLNDKIIFNTLHRALNTVFAYIFLIRLPRKIRNLVNEKILIFSEYPSLRRPRDIWLKSQFSKSLFFYFPHSPHIYTEEIDSGFTKPDKANYNKRNFLLLGHPADFSAINDGKEYADTNLEKVFIGHPKYSDSWLGPLKEESYSYRSEASLRKKTNILVISRGTGSYLDQEAYKSLVKTTIEVIDKNIPNFNLLVKKHPRESSSYWNSFLDTYESLTIVNEHILEIAKNVDFVISFWSSGAMDCFSLGVPVIEYYDPNKHSKQQVYEKDKFTTIYRKLGIVIPANNSLDLEREISLLIKSNYFPSLKPHPFYTELITSSNNWEKVIEDILLSHNLTG